MNKKDNIEYQSIVRLNHENSKKEYISQYIKLNQTGLEKDTLNKRNEIISCNLIDNESNRENLNDLSRRQHQIMTLDKDIKKLKQMNQEISLGIQNNDETFVKLIFTDFADIIVNV